MEALGTPEDGAGEWVEVRSTTRARRAQVAAASRPRAPQPVGLLAVPGLARELRVGDHAVVTWSPSPGVLYSLELVDADASIGFTPGDDATDALTWEERLR